MFHNPFNNKVVADIGKFLNEHRDDIDINPCLDGHAKEAAKSVAAQPILEERRNILTKAFNEAVKDCGCRGTNKESIEFSKAVDKHVRTNPPSAESVEEAVKNPTIPNIIKYIDGEIKANTDHQMVKNRVVQSFKNILNALNKIKNPTIPATIIKHVQRAIENYTDNQIFVNSVLADLNKIRDALKKVKTTNENWDGIARNNELEEAVTDYKVVGTATYMRKDKGRWSPVNFDIQFKEVGGTTYYRKDRGPWLPMKKGDKYLGKNP